MIYKTLYENMTITELTSMHKNPDGLNGQRFVKVHKDSSLYRAYCVSTTGSDEQHLILKKAIGQQLISERLNKVDRPTGVYLCTYVMIPHSTLPYVCIDDPDGWVNPDQETLLALMKVTRRSITILTDLVNEDGDHLNERYTFSTEPPVLLGYLTDQKQYFGVARDNATVTAEASDAEEYSDTGRPSSEDDDEDDSDGGEARASDHSSDGGDGGEARAADHPSDGGDGGKARAADHSSDGGDGGKARAADHPSDGGDGGKARAADHSSDGGDGGEARAADHSSDGGEARASDAVDEDVDRFGDGYDTDGIELDHNFIIASKEKIARLGFSRDAKFVSYRACGT
jgi:hypothetical protein